MWAFILRKLLYNVPVYLGTLLLLMAALRVNDPAYAYLGKNATEETIEQMRRDMGLRDPLLFDIAVWRRPWAHREGGLGGGCWTKGSNDTGAFKAIWSATVEPGTYRVEMTWPRIDGANPGASVEVQDAERRVSTSTLDQRLPPGAGRLDPEAEEGAIDNRWAQAGGETRWQVVTESAISTTTLRVLLKNRGSGTVIADAVRLTRIDAESEPVVFDDADESSFSLEQRPWTLGTFGRSLYKNQYFTFLGKVVTFDYSDKSWNQKGRAVGDILVSAIPKSLSVTVPEVAISTMMGVVIALVSSYFRGRWADRILMILAVLGMSISFLVYIIFGQFLGAFWPMYHEWTFAPFAIEGYEQWITAPGNWVRFCMLPVIIGVIVALGYDTRFYRAVMVEESGRDYIVTAMAKGASKPKIIFVHMLKNAMIPIITRVMSTLPFLITGSILLEMFFQIPGMGRELITAILAKDFPVIQAFVAVLAAFFIITIILTDVMYALVDPRVRLS